MPIEIKELNIKAYIDNSTAPNQPDSNTDASSNSNTNGNANSNINSTENIIAACVEQVLQILKDKEER